MVLNFEAKGPQPTYQKQDKQEMTVVDDMAGRETPVQVMPAKEVEKTAYVVPFGDDIQLPGTVDGVIATPREKADRLGFWAGKQGEDLLAAAAAASYGYEQPMEGLSTVDTVEKILADSGYADMFEVDSDLSSENGIVLVGKTVPMEDVVVTSARGTRNFNDVMADVQLMMGRGQMDELPPLLRLAQEIGRLAGDRQGEIEGMVGLMKEKYPDRYMAVTGHSLGGHLAREAGRLHHVPSVTFNPAVGPSDMLENMFSSSDSRDMHKVVRTPVDIVSALSLLGGGNVETVPDRAGGFLGHDMANFGRSAADLQLIREGALRKEEQTVIPAFVDEYGTGNVPQSEDAVSDNSLRRLRRAPNNSIVNGKAVSDWYGLARGDMYTNGPRDSVQMASLCEALMGLRDSGTVGDERLMLALQRLVGGQCGRRLTVSGPGRVDSHPTHNHAVKAMIGNRPEPTNVSSYIMDLFPELTACSADKGAFLPAEYDATKFFGDFEVYDNLWQWDSPMLNDTIFEMAMDQYRKHAYGQNASLSAINSQRKAGNIKVAEQAKASADEKKVAGKAEFEANIARSMAKQLNFFVSHPVTGASLTASFARGAKMEAVRDWLAEKVGCESEQLFIGGTKGKAYDVGATLVAIGVKKDQTLASWIKARGGMEAEMAPDVEAVVEAVIAAEEASGSGHPSEVLESRLADKTHNSVDQIVDNALNGTPPGFANITRGTDAGEAFIRGLPFVQEVVNGSTKMVTHWGAETHLRIDQLYMQQPAGTMSDERDNVVGQWGIRLIENRNKLAVTNPEYVSVAKEAIATGMVAPGATPSRLTQHALNGTAAAMAVSAHMEEFDGWGMDKTALLYNVIVELILYNPYSMQGFTRTAGVFFQFGTKLPAPAANPWWNDMQDLCVLVPNDGQDPVVSDHATVWMYPRSPYQALISIPTLECSAHVNLIAPSPGDNGTVEMPWRTGNRVCMSYDIEDMPNESIMLGACTINQLAAVTCGQLPEVAGWESFRWNDTAGVGSNDLTGASGHSVTLVPILTADYTSEGLIDIIALYGASNPIDMAQVGTWVDTRGLPLEDATGQKLMEEHSRIARLAIQGTRHSGQFRTLGRVLLVLVDDMGTSGSNITNRPGAMGSGRDVKISQLRRPPAAANNERYHPAQDFVLSTGTANGLNSLNIWSDDYGEINGFQLQVTLPAGQQAQPSDQNGPINIGPALIYRWSTPSFWVDGICTPVGGAAQTICTYDNFQNLTAARYKLQMSYISRIGAPQHCWESALAAAKMNSSVVRPQASVQGTDVRYAWFFNPNPTSAGLNPGVPGTGSSSASAQNWYLPITGFDPAFPAPGAAPYRVGYYDSEKKESATALEAIMCRPGQMLPQLWMANDYALDAFKTIKPIGADPAQGLDAAYCAQVGTGAVESVDQWMYQVDPISNVFQAAKWIKATNVISPEVISLSANQLRCRVAHGATGLQLATQVAANVTGVGQWAVYKPPVYSQFIEMCMVRKEIMHAFLHNALSRTLGNMPGWGFELASGRDYYRVNLWPFTGAPTDHFDAYLRPLGWEQEDPTAYSPLPPGTFTYFGVDPNVFKAGVSSTQEATTDFFGLSPSAFGMEAQRNQVNPWNGVVESMTLLPKYSSGVGPYSNEAESKAWGNLASTLFMASGAGSLTVPPASGHIFVPGLVAVPPTKDGMWWRLVTGTSTLTALPQVNFMPVVIWAPNATMWRQLVRANQDYRGPTVDNPQFLLQISPSIPDFVNNTNGEPRHMVLNGDYNVYFAGATRREMYILYRQPSMGAYPLTFPGASTSSVTVSNIISLF